MAYVHPPAANNANVQIGHERLLHVIVRNKQVWDKKYQ